MRIPVLLGIAALLLVDPPWAAAAGRFLDETDSLGFAEFRALAAKDQQRARERAEYWLGELRRTVTVEAEEERIRYGLDCAATAVGHCPYLAEAWIQYADVAAVLGDFALARQCLAHARRTLPYERDPQERERARIALEKVQALTEFNLGDHDAALASALEVVAVDPLDWENRLVAARCLLHEDRLSEAFEMIALYPDDGPHAAEARSVVGSIELQRGRFGQAEREFARARDIGLRDAVFENDQGRLALESGDLARAAEHFRAALALRPDFPTARCNLGVALKRAGDLEAATAVLDSLVATDPSYAPGQLNLAEVYRERAALADGADREAFARRAFDHYTRALEAGAPADEVLPRRATLSAYAPGLAGAVPGTDGLDAHALTVLARAEKDAGRLDRAQEFLEAAVSRDDTDALAFAELGEVRLRRGDAAGARESLERACALDRSLVVSRINLSVACERLGDLTAAWAALDEAIEIDPDHPLVVHRSSAEGMPRRPR